MSIRALNFAFECDLPPLTKLVFIAIADYVDDHGQWKIKHSTLEKKTGMSRSSIIRHVRDLVNLGLLQIDQTRRKDGKQGANIYRVSESAPVNIQSVTEKPCKGVRETHHLPPESLPPVESSNFDRFWSIYPLRKDKKKARSAFAKALKETDVEEIIRGAKAYREYIEITGTAAKYIKHPTTWLNGGCWADEHQISGVDAPRNRNSSDGATEAARRAYESLCGPVRAADNRDTGDYLRTKQRPDECAGSSRAVITDSAIGDDCSGFGADAPDDGFENDRYRRAYS